MGYRYRHCKFYDWGFSVFFNFDFIDEGFWCLPGFNLPTVIFSPSLSSLRHFGRPPTKGIENNIPLLITSLLVGRSVFIYLFFHLFLFFLFSIFYFIFVFPRSPTVLPCLRCPRLFAGFHSRSCVATVIFFPPLLIDTLDSQLQQTFPRSSTASRHRQVLDSVSIYLHRAEDSIAF